jgi:glycosyltransferase involved in cell wall biosynthesis
MSGLPRLSIVTPSYDQAEYLEETVLSVVNQEYPDVEYIIMDGGSTDGSVDIIRKYQDRLAYWVSEHDDGQADAIYRGFERSTGEVLAWINSDDYYFPGALAAAGAFFRDNPQTELLIGNSMVVDEQGRILYARRSFPVTFNRLLYWHWGFSQPATFWRRQPFFESGGFDTTMRFCFDYDMYLRLLERRPASRIDRCLAAFRLHGASKTSLMSDVRSEEDRLLHQRYGRSDKNRLYVTTVRRLYRFVDDCRLRWWRLLSVCGVIEPMPTTWEDIQ